MSFKYDLVDDFDKIFDEKGNTFLALRKVKWGNNAPKLELRKWYSNDTGETPGKGFTFLTEEGPNELVKVMVEAGYGIKEEILPLLEARPDTPEEEREYGEEEEIDDGTIYYDPREALGFGEE